VNHQTTTTDNWDAIREACLEVLPAPIIAFIEQNQGLEHSEGQLIAVLHMVQAHFGYLGADKMNAVAQLAQIPLAKVTGVATFYHYFRLEPRGKHMINVCLGTACYVKGAEKLAQRLMDELGIHFGETTRDGLFSLDSTRCLGTCGLAPVVMVDDQVYGPMTATDVSVLLAKYLKKGKVVAE